MANDSASATRNKFERLAAKRAELKRAMADPATSDEAFLQAARELSLLPRVHCVYQSTTRGRIRKASVFGHIVDAVCQTPARKHKTVGLGRHFTSSGAYLKNSIKHYAASGK